MKRPKLTIQVQNGLAILYALCERHASSKGTQKPGKSHEKAVAFILERGHG